MNIHTKEKLDSICMRISLLPDLVDDGLLDERVYISMIRGLSQQLEVLGSEIERSNVIDIRHLLRSERRG